ncbi:hypothetical protein JRQ81_008052 [Phrynocephalus forsythii]|uniref:Uncharacterized protein n=1 Tax=Phrynocephalus forsythii TaxID=171643 RepID=A0A9Q0XBC2_9SAUR|nr:hypothetical protein JRQ81_008052 [Phrynocephalus forsythii]
MASAASSSGPTVGPQEGGKGPDEAPALQYSLLLAHLVGEKRGPRPAQAFDPAALGGGFPAPPKSPEQKRVERAMESCAFKAALACVGGEREGEREGGGALRRPTWQGCREGGRRGVS